MGDAALEFKLKRTGIVEMKGGVANIRKQVNPEQITALAASLKKQQLHPVVLAPDMTIVDGYRRWLAAQQAGIDWLWAVIANRALTKDELISMQLAISLHREDFTEQEKVSACEELLQTQPDMDQKQLAARLDLGPGTISKWLSVAPERVVPEVRAAFFDARIGLKAVYPISQAPKEHQQSLLEIALTGATRAQLESQVRRVRKSSGGERIARVKCVLRTGEGVTVSGKDLSLDSAIDALGTILREAKKARQQNLDIKTFERILNDKATSQA